MDNRSSHGRWVTHWIMSSNIWAHVEPGFEGTGDGGWRWPDSPVPPIHLYKPLFSKAVIEIGTTRKGYELFHTIQLLNYASKKCGKG